MKRMRTSVRFRIYRDTRRSLSQLYPKAFPARGHRPPLKIGVFKDITSDPACTVPPGHLRVFLSVWASSTSYLRSVAARKHRVCKDGGFGGEVLPEHAMEARNRLEERIRSKARAAREKAV